MRLLIVTQKVDKDDNLLGFFHQWLLEFAKQCEEVIVVCLEARKHELPSNVEVFSLGKEKQELGIRNYELGIVRRLSYVFNFYRHIWRERKNYDAVFVHMNREYVLLGGLFWRVWRKKIGLWFVHFETPLSLKIAERLSDVIFTASKESFQLPSKKVSIVGHGIDTRRFYKEKPTELREPLQFLYVGKITPIKNIHILIKAAKILKHSWDKSFVITIIGPTTTREDEVYKQSLLHTIAEEGINHHIRFLEPVPYQEIPSYYEKTHAVVNLCPTGGIDKMVVEGMSSKAFVFASNETFRTLFGPYADHLLYPYQDAQVLAEKIRLLFLKNEQELITMREYLYEQAKRHSLENLIPKILKHL